MKKGKADKKAIDLQKKKVDDFSTKMKLAEKLAGVALGTSRLNYIDPRITLAWCKEAEFDYKRLFPKTQQVSSGCVAAFDLSWRNVTMSSRRRALHVCMPFHMLLLTLRLSSLRARPSFNGPSTRLSIRTPKSSLSGEAWHCAVAVMSCQRGKAVCKMRHEHSVRLLLRCCRPFCNQCTSEEGGGDEDFKVFYKACTLHFRICIPVAETRLLRGGSSS